MMSLTVSFPSSSAHGSVVEPCFQFLADAIALRHLYPVHSHGCVAMVEQCTRGRKRDGGLHWGPMPRVPPEPWGRGPGCISTGTSSLPANRSDELEIGLRSRKGNPCVKSPRVHTRRALPLPPLNGLNFRKNRILDRDPRKTARGQATDFRVPKSMGRCEQIQDRAVACVQLHRNRRGRLILHEHLSVIEQEIIFTHAERVRE